MPRILLPIPDTEETVVRPAIMDITRHLFEYTGIPKDTRIFYPGDLERTMQQGSAISSKQEDNLPKLGYSNQINVMVEENYEEESLLSTAVFGPEHLYIFRDDRIQTSIRPVYSTTEVSINFTYRAQDKEAARRWRDDIRTRVSTMRDVHVFNLTYYYLIPTEFIYILQKLHGYRETVAGYGEDWDTYFNSNRSKRVRLVTDLAGREGVWAVGETQMRIQGWFDFTGVPEVGSREGDSSAWNIGFTYKFNYDKPISSVLEYPLMVHNQLIDAKLRPSEAEQPPYEVERIQRYYSNSTLNYSMFEVTNPMWTLNSYNGYAIPEFDEFIPESVLGSTMRIYTVLANIDPANPSFLFNLNETGSIEFESDVLKLLKEEVPYILKPYGSIFTLSLYQGLKLSDYGLLTLDSDLNVGTNKELSLRNYYHVRLGLVTDLEMLSKDTRDRLREFGTALIKLLDTIDPTLKTRGLLPTIIGKDYIRESDLEKAIKEINSFTDGVGNMQQYQFNTVETLFIEAGSK